MTKRPSPSSSRRTGRTEDDLPHPDQEAEATDHAHGYDRPYSESKDEECQEFTPARRAPVIDPDGRSAAVSAHGVLRVLDGTRRTLSTSRQPAGSWPTVRFCNAVSGP